MAEKTKSKNFLDSIKKLIGVEPGTKLKPMVAYNSAIFFSGGGPYVLGCYLLPFLTRVEGLDVDQYGTVMLFSCICDAITDPLMGIITDRTRHKNGRHRPYLKWGIIPAILAYLFMWNSFGISAAGDSNKTMWWYIFAYMFYKTVSTFITVPHTAMLPQLAPGYNLRTQYNAVKTVIDAVASYSSFFISTVILGGINALVTNPTFSPEHRSRFAIMGAVLCLWTSIPLFFTYKGTHEESSLDQVNEKLDIKAFVKQYTNVIKNRTFRKYFMFGFIILFSSSFVSQCFYNFLEVVMHQETHYSMLTLVCGIGEAAGFFPAYMLSIKKNKQLPAKIFVPVAIFALAVAWMGRAATSPVVIFVVELLYGVGLAGMASVQSNIFPDVTDVDEMITGERREGVIATFSTFIKKFVSGFAGFGIGKLLAAFGYSTKIPVEELSQTAVFGVTISFTLIPMCFLSLAFLVILTYNLTSKQLSLVKEKIKEKKENGCVSVTDEEKKILEKLSGISFDKMWIGQDQTANSINI